MKAILLLTFILVLAFGELSAQISQEDYSFKSPDNVASLKKINLWATQYFIHKFSSGGKIPILNQKGESMHLFADTCDFCEAALEGTAYVTDNAGNSIVINYAKTGASMLVDCRKCKKYERTKLKVESWGKTLWAKSSGFGDGVLNYRLLPFRTIAVDRTSIAYGTVIFIPLVKDKIIELPNGQKVKHDGYFFAGDTGGAIKGNHIDVFTGIYAGNPFIDVIQSNSKKTFDAYIIADASIIQSLKNQQTKNSN